jgi:ribose 1,5-bisphosphate isomerase
MMAKHPAVETVIGRMRADIIGGAADTAKEVAAAIAAMVNDSEASTVPELSKEIEKAVDEILEVLPSLAPPINVLHILMRQVDIASEQGNDVVELKKAIDREVERFQVWAENALDNVAQYGAEKIKDGDTVFMYSMSSTVWRVLKRAKDDGKSIRVVVTESRPANEGLWTVDKMIEYGIPITVGIDAAIGVLIPDADMVMVGADVIAASGEALCKVGTYPAALVAKAHGVPFYIAADTLKFDTNTLLGLPFRIDNATREEILEADSSEEAIVHSPHFDITPPELITAVITERGFLNPAAASTWMQEMALSETLQAKMPTWTKREI